MQTCTNYHNYLYLPPSDESFGAFRPQCLRACFRSCTLSFWFSIGLPQMYWKEKYLITSVKGSSHVDCRKFLSYLASHWIVVSLKVAPYSPHDKIQDMNPYKWDCSLTPEIHDHNSILKIRLDHLATFCYYTNWGFVTLQKYLKGDVWHLLRVIS